MAAKDRTGSVIVGVDGSPGSKRALDWAVDKSDVLGPVHPISAYHVDALGDGIGTPGLYQDLTDIMREDAEDRMAEMLAAHPELKDRSEVVRGYPGPALVKAATEQRLLVVGSRGRSALAETLLGSVASYCVKHSTVPVAVIPEGTPVDRPLEHLLVGVDGSENAEAAIRWAARHVSPGGRITALGCWLNAPYALELVPPAPQADEATRTMVQATIDRALADADDGPEDGVTIDVRSVMGDPRIELRRSGGVADLVVIGSRGHRGAAYLLLGSVATSLAHHPTVATVVVPYN